MNYELRIKNAIGFYQKVVSPFTRPSCRFLPTCSGYSQLAIEKYGVAMGLLLTAWRVLRCNPLSRPRVDLP